ncbi:unnamed protein product [Didymodactylos carnosus]|uniref:ATP-dependent DNA helicase n=1 Tax=Didymodactylos carnosus TaxID=1234261 RepID=A0A814N4Z6_9BILA|nr:unnamed protein product [Didymodactylos carnosus]CAF1086948.1 unnamed protein product [Didymodactylos carnosus]CAF3612318.1 unnamed protein product [Didymodactylos carnosus]CAF3852494.1 unnamed protein product [Didymodactylos carnosus]
MLEAETLKDNIETQTIKLSPEEIAEMQKTFNEALSKIKDCFGILNMKTNSYKSAVDYRVHEKQKTVINFVSEYLQKTLEHVRQPKDVKKPKPFHLIVNGLGGSGKGFTIQIIEELMKNYCVAEQRTRNTPRFKTAMIKIAFTSKAACKIGGYTIHTALGLTFDKNNIDCKINDLNMNSMRNRMRGLILDIIDEVSLVSKELLETINIKLNKIFDTSDPNKFFGNCCVIKRLGHLITHPRPTLLQQLEGLAHNL